jgi:hypothetical protein
VWDDLEQYQMQNPGDWKILNDTSRRLVDHLHQLDFKEAVHVEGKPVALQIAGLQHKGLSVITAKAWSLIQARVAWFVESKFARGRFAKHKIERRVVRGLLEVSGNDLDSWFKWSDEFVDDMVAPNLKVDFEYKN